MCLEEALRYANKRRTFGKTLFERKPKIIFRFFDLIVITSTSTLSIYILMLVI